MKKYSTYKDSNIKWIGQIPSDWDVVKIKYSDLLIMGQSPSSDDYNYEKIGFPFLQGNAEFGKLFPVPKLYCNTSNKYAEKNDILLSVRAPIGAVNIATEKTGIGRGLCAIRNSKHFQKYLYYLLLNLNEELNKYGTGSTFTAISTEQIKNIFLPLLSWNEQMTIASFLDYQTTQIDKLITAKEKLVEKLQAQRKAIINEAITGQAYKNGLIPPPKGIDLKYKYSGIEWLGEIPVHWKVKKLKYFAQIYNGKDQKSVLIDSGGYPVFGTGGEFGRASSFLYDKPSVLLGRKGTIDNPLYIEEPFWTVDTLFYTRIFDDVCSKYFFYSCKTIDFEKYETGSAVPSMTQDTLLNIQRIYPPYEEQIIIADYIDKIIININNLIIEVESSINNLKQYKQSLISEAVTGKIDVRDWKLPIERELDINSKKETVTKP